MPIKLIVAHSKNRVIGKDGKMPWVMKDDLKHFRKETKDNFIVMGRKTFESLKCKPLKDRINIVLSKTTKKSKKSKASNENFGIYNDIDKLVYELKSYKELTAKDFYIIGGGQIYKQFLDLGMVDEIIATEIDCEVDGDTFFPEFTGFNEYKSFEIEKKEGVNDYNAVVRYYRR